MHPTRGGLAAGGDPSVEVSRHSIERVFREESGRILASLIRVLGDFDLAEDALQEAFTVALERWPADGVPEYPGAWITTAARHKAIDLLRRRKVRDEDTAKPVSDGESATPVVENSTGYARAEEETIA